MRLPSPFRPMTASALAIAIAITIAVVLCWTAYDARPLSAQAAQDTSDSAGADAAQAADDAMLPFDTALDEDDILRPEGYAYDAAGRRDPFRSLLVSSRGRERVAGPRPAGIPGLLIEEIDVTGVFVLGDGPVAQIRSTREASSYLLHEGDKLFDGDVVSISPTEIVFKQIVNDPAAIKPFQEVVKTLNREIPQ